MGEPSLRERAIRHLARREHSRSELARKLAAHGETTEVEDVITRMGELGLQSDERFAEAWVRGKAGRFGAARLRNELSRRGIAADTITEALATECGDSELDRARAVWQAKFGSLPGDRREWARQARFLQGRGFAVEVIRKLLKESPDESA